MEIKSQIRIQILPTVIINEIKIRVYFGNCKSVNFVTKYRLSSAFSLCFAPNMMVT